MVGRQGVCFIRGHIGEVGEVEDQVGAPFGYGVPDICVGKEVVDGRFPMLVGVLVTSRKPQERVVERRIRYAYRLIEPPDLAINQLGAGFPLHRSAYRPGARTRVSDADTSEKPGFQPGPEGDGLVVERHGYTGEELIETTGTPRCLQASGRSKCKNEFADARLGAKTAYIVVEGKKDCAANIIGQHVSGNGIGHGAGVRDAGGGKQHVYGPLIVVLKAECVVSVFL